MSRNNISYPYPVLSSFNDDIEPALDQSDFSAEIEVTSNGDYKVSFKLNLTDPCIKSLIETDYAEYAVEIDCSSTLYRRCKPQNDGNYEIILPHDCISGRVVFKPFVIAKKAFEYKNENFHPDYGDNSFPVTEGDVLVVFDDFDYDFSIDYEKLRAFTSIMHIRKAEDSNQKETRYFSGEDKIVIELPEEKFNFYQQFKNDTRYTAAIHASLAQNALLSVLLQEESWEPDETNQLWKRTIIYRVNHDNTLLISGRRANLSDKEDLVQLAHLLLGDPVERMFNDFKSSISED
jgi:hypothetical protein